ncbi:actin related protein 2/3 complex subunit 3 [Clonorchis sinensis]|uniref:Actin related protein 2/3 complex subunit 3 n=1 Tax=Clonorchis sinensis TaxID=79923 RepID=G7YDI8_CLOSI|nr:actin related protein 2/3 complex subunit 3 [Clonorchis sinensis]
MALLPLRTKFRGPAPAMPDLEKDIIDEALYLFKSLIFLRQYEIKSEADRVLVYLVLYTLDCLKKIQKCPNKIVATKELASLALARFDIPGDPGFPRELNSLYAKPKNQNESDTMRNYITQLRQELGSRLVELVYPGDNCPPSKVLSMKQSHKVHNSTAPRMDFQPALCAYQWLTVRMNFLRTLYPSSSPIWVWALWRYPSPRKTVAHATNNTVMPNRQSRGVISRVALLYAYSWFSMPKSMVETKRHITHNLEEGLWRCYAPPTYLFVFEGNVDERIQRFSE